MRLRSLLVFALLAFGANVAFAQSVTFTISASPNPALVGQTVTISGSVNVFPGTGTTVTFFDNGTQIGTSTFTQSGNGGVTTFQTSFSSQGSHALSASFFLGDFGTVRSNTFNETVNRIPVSTTVTSTPNPTTYCQSITITATVAPQAGIGTNATPTGSVSFFDGQTQIGSGQLSKGVATLTVFLPGGIHTLNALYNGDNSFLSGNGSTTQQITPFTPTATLSSSPNPSNFGQTVIITVSVPGCTSGSNIGTTPTGTVSFFDGSLPLGSAPLVNGSASIQTSTLAVGTHPLDAQYGGDSNYGTAITKTVNQVVQQVTVSTTTTLTAAPPSPSTFGQTVTLTATVAATSGSAIPTGTVTFSDGGTALAAPPLSNGSVSFQISNLAIGTHTFTATYNGVTGFQGSTSSPLSYTVNKASTQTTLTSSATSITTGQSVIFTAHVAPATATGNVSFQDNGTAIGSGTLANGTATFTTSSLGQGTHSVVAAYPGDSNFGASSSTAVTVTVSNATSPTQTSLTAAPPSPSSFGQTVTLTATVTATAGAAAPTGTVTFNDGSTSLGQATLSNGTASVQVPNLAVGNHSFTATYGGATGFQGSTSGALSYTVNKAASQTSLTSSTASATVGQPVTFTARVAPATATGNVAFQDGGTTIGNGTLANGVATLTTSSLGQGTHAITAVYSGDTNFSGSSSAAVTVNIGNATSNTQTTLTAAPSSPSTFGQTVTLTATVTATPAGSTPVTGSVTFADGGSSLGTASLSNGSASISVSTLGAGNHTLTATYTGATGFQASASSPLSYTVNKAGTSTSLSTSANSAASGQPVTFTARVTPATATGTVTFQDGGVTIQSIALSNGVASLTTSALTGGSHTITAAYNGDTNFNGSVSSPVSVTIGTPSTQVGLVAFPTSITFGQKVDLTANVVPNTATGTITFRDNGNILGTAQLNAGTAAFSTTQLAVGSHQITAAYGGDSTFASNTSQPVDVEVAKGTTTTFLTVTPTASNPGQGVLLSASIVPQSATGTVAFKDGTNTLSTVNVVGGVAVLNTTSLTTGTHSLTAVYSGDSNFSGSTSTPVSASVGLTQTTTTLAASPTTANAGQSVTLTATVTPSGATGTVAFQEGGNTIGSGTLTNGTATFSTASLTGGSHSIVAVYSGDTKFATSSSAAVTVTIGKVQTTTTLSVSPNPATTGQTVTLTATVSPSSATGNVNFLDGSTTLGSGALSGGKATFTISTLTGGPHDLTASYDGDANNQGSSSTAVTLNVNQVNTLKIASPATLPPGTVGVAFTQPFTASGGTAPFTFSMVSSDTKDLNISAAGVLSGTPTAAGAFKLTVQVKDSANPAQTATANFTFNVTFPAIPPTTLSVSAQPTSPADQPTVKLALAQNYPFALTGTASLSFAPNAASLPANFTNTGLQFATGGSTVQVSIPANSGTITLPPIQVGTVAGTITVKLDALNPPGSCGCTIGSVITTITVPKIAPVITPGSVKITSVTSSGFTVVMDANSTPRDLSSASLTFTAAPGTQLNGTQFNVSLTSAATTWFPDTGANRGVANGGSFSVSIPFNFSGDTSSIGSVSVTLTNSVGTSAAVSGGR